VSRSGGFETTEFRRSFSIETDRLLRRRLVWFAAVWGGLGFLGFFGVLLISLFTEANLLTLMLRGTGGVGKQILPALGALLWMAAYGGVLFLVFTKRSVSTSLIVRLTIALIVCDGIFALTGRIGGVDGYNLWYFWLAHLIACLVFPWTVRQALIPIAIILPVSALSRILFEGGSVPGTIGGSVFVLFMMTPGVVICGIRHSQRVQKASNRFLNQRYGMLRQELAYARQVHEALFPTPKPDGPVCFSYKYEPMRQIGGDYLYAHTCTRDGRELFNVVLLDVTGHGIPAALTVNRLHGEIDLRFAEQPDIGPGELLRLLNRYIALTLAKHSIFATAVCFQFDHEHGVVRYASGGHPPSFIRGIDGTLRELDPTSFVLGACPDKDFDPGEREVEFHEGDSLIAYTDGAIEARSIQGEMLRIDGLRRLLSGPSMPGVPGGLGSWSELILSEVTRHRGGMPPEDDTLAIEVYRAIRTGAPLDRVPDSAAAARG
jgi:serine phosphatase RsbU (regulator of sigma subunit)